MVLQRRHRTTLGRIQRKRKSRNADHRTAIRENSQRVPLTKRRKIRPAVRRLHTKARLLVRTERGNRSHKVILSGTVEQAKRSKKGERLVAPKVLDGRAKAPVTDISTVVGRSPDREDGYRTRRQAIHEVDQATHRPCMIRNFHVSRTIL